MNEAKPISLFYSYSHKDEDLRLKLQDHLAVLRWNSSIAEWHDRNIDAGKEWAKEIDHHLASADIILLLVSASFIASQYCWSVEIAKALDRHQRGEARVIPVILKPCRWQSAPFAKLQATPKDGKPVTAWPDQDAALDDVASQIERVVKELRTQRGASERTPHFPAPAYSPASPPSIADFTVFRDVDAPWCPEMVMLPAGTFLMGSPQGEEGRDDDEGPQHWVTIGTRFALGRYAVTFDEYDRFCDATNRERPGDNGWGRGRRPVINVSWLDAVAYCAWLAQETGQPYRLPSEAEWEYACRSGTTTPFSFGETITPEQVNYRGNYPYTGLYRDQTVPVGSLPANPWGLYEMHGNVWEWCADGLRSYTADAVTDPAGPIDPGVWRVLRGGSWHILARHVRSASRGSDSGGRDVNIGFRCTRVQGS